MQDGNQEKRIKCTPDVLDPKPIRWHSPQWRTPELPSGYFVTTGRFPYSAQSQATPITDDDGGHSPEVHNYGGPPISAHIERVVRQVAKHVRPEFAHSRPPNQRPPKQPPPKQPPPTQRPEVAGTQRPPRRPEFTGSQQSRRPEFVDSQQQDNWRPEFAGSQQSRRTEFAGSQQQASRRPEFAGSHRPTKRPQEEGCSMPSKKRTHVELRDPLLHKPLVIAPGPIIPGQNQTPRAERSYTHVSYIELNSQKMQQY